MSVSNLLAGLYCDKISLVLVKSPFREDIPITAEVKLITI
jgi:hypothetical protein